MITFQRIGLRFQAIGNQRIDIYDVATGKHLLTPVEFQLQAEQGSKRAEQEAQRADQAEERAAEYEAMLKKAGLL